MQTGRAALWAPVAFGCGAGAYLAAPVEPSLWVVLGVLGSVFAGFLASRRLGWPSLTTLPLLLLTLAVAGFAAGAVRTLHMEAPILPRSEEPRRVEAWVVDVDSPGANGARLLLAPVRIEGVAPEATPRRVRVTLPTFAAPGPGSPVRIAAVLGSPPPPAAPGAYDFARDAYFEGIGAVGYAPGDPGFVTLPPAPWRLRLMMEVNAARWSLARQIVEIMGGREGGIAAAMITGHEAWVSPEDVEAMRVSGLAHILSISGLHMAIVGGFVFAALRFLIAAIPWLALRINGKKMAAIGGALAIGAYLILSGAPPPAQRAAVTAFVAFAAVLADRQAISLRALATAALIVMALQPEAVGSPGFQMSFAATAALVALAEAWKPPMHEANRPWPLRFFRSLGGWLLVSLGASLVAGLATTPFAIQHFNRVATFGLPANLAVAPISSFVMMPALAIGAVLAPLGLGEAPLAVAGWAIEAMTTISAFAAAQPGSTMIIASAPAWALPAAFLGVLWVCLWKGRLRWLGLPLALAVNLAPRPPAPDAWIDAEGSAAAVRTAKEAILARPDARRFAADLWARRRGLSLPADEEAAKDSAFDCGRYDCAAREAAALRLAVSWSRRTPPPQALERLCEGAEIVVLRSDTPSACEGPLVLSARDFDRGGAAEIWRTAEGWRIEWAQDRRGRRPWTLSGSGG